ncbi:acyl carrier protein [Priestia aryabhattai]|uniref:acyl carrier protein n=1 Tax=Priestia megaterium TaxID=1404 RepID=UPI0039B9BEDB
MKTKEKVSFEEFKKVVAERLKISEENISRDALWVKDIGISSVDLVKIIMLVRQKFGVKIPASKIGTIKTVNDIYILVDGE